MNPINNSKNISTSQANLTANIDWLQFRIDDIELNHLLEFLTIPIDMFIRQINYLAGYKHYTECYEFQQIKIYYGVYLDEFNLSHDSFMVLASGSACRYLEDVIFKRKGIDNWKDFLKQLLITFEQLDAAIDFRRIDMCIDDFNPIPYFTPAKLLKHCEDDRYIYGRSQKYSVQGTEQSGMTLYIGASKSDRRIRIYDKEKEQQNKKELSHSGSWIRTEIQFMRAIANTSVQRFTNMDVSLIDFVKGYLKQQLHFYTKPDWRIQKKPLETRKWTRFLGSSEPFQLALSHQKTTMQEKIEWLINGGGLAILKSYDLLYNNNLLPADLEKEHKKSISELINYKDYPIELSKTIINHISRQQISNNLKESLILSVKLQTYDPFENEKIRRQTSHGY